MKYLIAISLIFLFGLTPKGQAQEPEQFMKAIIANDTILNGNYFEFRILIKNMKGNFVPPSFSNFEIVGGPNYKSNIKFINGNLTKEVLYTYILKPKNTGLLHIEEAFFKFEGEQDFISEPIQVLVLDNPDNLKQEYKINYDSETIVFSPQNFLAQDSIKSKPIRQIKKI